MYDITTFSRPDLPCTKRELLEEIRDAMGGIEHLVQAFYGWRIYLDDGMKEGRLKSAYMCRLGEIVYDYAIEGMWPDPRRVDDVSRDKKMNIDLIFLDFAAFCMTSIIAEELYCKEPTACAHKVLAMSIVRAGLDEELFGKCPDSMILDSCPRNLTLPDVALIAQMNEKSVRNATQPRSNDRLKTIKVGTRTMVEAKEALLWLKGRRSFKETQPPEILKGQHDEE